MDEASVHRKLEIQELEEIRNEAFESSHIYKDKTKAFHDKYLSHKTFEISQKSRSKVTKQEKCSSKLRSRWVGPLIVTNVFNHGAVEIKSNKTGKVFKVNGHRLNVFYEGFQEKDMEALRSMEHGAWIMDHGALEHEKKMYWSCHGRAYEDITQVIVALSS
ncbi:uncharacterized protein LOC111880931 [Lactuca sativa]|uniref:uncharacterized protein LOC111880931 n=1 Tax=Lactuca sativa TaxID=4236 RepID=UPI000CD7E7ED|nr:uncharacterized protein LOC111880931 [Lactuca sativa]